MRTFAVHSYLDDLEVVHLINASDRSEAWQIAEASEDIGEQYDIEEVDTATKGIVYRNSFSEY